MYMYICVGNNSENGGHKFERSRVYRKVWREERDGREYIIMLQSQNKRKNTCYKNYN